MRIRINIKKMTGKRAIQVEYSGFMSWKISSTAKWSQKLVGLLQWIAQVGTKFLCSQSNLIILSEQNITTMTNASPRQQLYWLFPAANKQYNSYQPLTTIHKLCLHHHSPCLICCHQHINSVDVRQKLTTATLVQLASARAISNRPKPPSASPTYEQH